MNADERRAAEPQPKCKYHHGDAETRRLHGENFGERQNQKQHQKQNRTQTSPPTARWGRQRSQRNTGGHRKQRIIWQSQQFAFIGLIRSPMFLSAHISGNLRLIICDLRRQPGLPLNAQRRVALLHCPARLRLPWQDGFFSASVVPPNGPSSA